MHESPYIPATPHSKGLLTVLKFQDDYAYSFDLTLFDHTVLVLCIARLY